jgi:hypothetical protein
MCCSITIGCGTITEESVSSHVDELQQLYR